MSEHFPSAVPGVAIEAARNDDGTWSWPGGSGGPWSRDVAERFFATIVPDGHEAPTPPAPPPSIPPLTVTNFQIRAALMAMPGPSGGTMYDAVDAAVHAQGGIALQAWEYANEVNRTGPLVQQMAAGFGFDEAALDALFIAAAGISA